MTIANQIRSFYVTVSPETGRETFDWDALVGECEEKGKATQDWDNETTEYDFADGSVLVICNSEVSAYGSR